MARYPTAEWRPIPDASQGTYAADLDGGPVLVIHTTEGSTLAAAEAAYRAKRVVPHFTADYYGRRFAQHVDTNRSASALRNLAGGVETNREGRVIQIELVGFADQTHRYSDDRLAWEGAILAEIIERENIPPTHPTFVGRDAGTIATTTAPQRMSADRWRRFSGICGHQHVPENTHWDPGAYPLDRALDLGGLMALTEDDKTWLRALLVDAAGPRTPQEYASGQQRSEVHRWTREIVVWMREQRLAAAATAQNPPPPPTVQLDQGQVDQLAGRLIDQLGPPLAATLAKLLAARLAE